MAASTITRVAWTDGASGTVVNNARKNSDIYDKIDQMFAGAGSYTTFEFGGNVQVDGYLNLKGAGSDPAVSAASTARVAYNTARPGALRISVNGSAFNQLGGVLFNDANYCGGTQFGRF